MRVAYILGLVLISFILCYSFPIKNLNLFKDVYLFQSMLSLNKNLDTQDAITYTNIFSKYAKKYNLDPFLLISIAKQESDFNLNSKNGYIRNNTFHVTDFCMMQIHYTNVAHMKLDSSRLLNDADYCISTGIKILLNFKGLSSKDKFWWTRYNSSNPELREKYKNLVMTHYNNLKKVIPNMNKIVKMYTVSTKG